MQGITRLGLVGLAVAGLCVGVTGLVSADAAASHPVVVVSGLNNPRQLDLVGNTLLIAEAGKGGNEAVVSSPEGGDTHIGRTGSISEVYSPQYAHDTSPVRVVTGLMSGAGQDGSFAVGSDGVAARNPNGPIYIQETYVPRGALPTAALKHQDGHTLYAYPYHALHAFANPSYFELSDPDKKGFDSDPYAIVARKSDYLVADAAGNDVLRLDSGGHAHLWHVFPNVTTGACAGQSDPSPKFPGCNFVPTSIAVDSHGFVYVGGLSSLTPHMGQVVKLSSDGTKVIGTWHGFSGVSGLAIGPTGVLYVSELFADEAHPPFPQVQGVLTRIDTHNVRTHRDIPFPAGLAVDSHGVVFVSAWSVAPAGGLAGPATSGQVWRFKW